MNEGPEKGYRLVRKAEMDVVLIRHWGNTGAGAAHLIFWEESHAGNTGKRSCSEGRTYPGWL